MIRTYHGCKIESLPDCQDVGSDGWKHIVRRGDMVVAETITLGLAIQVAKGVNALVEHLEKQQEESQIPGPTELVTEPTEETDSTGVDLEPETDSGSDTQPVETVDTETIELGDHSE